MRENIDPWYITGFTNADGCFSIHFETSPSSRFGYRLKPVYSVTQHRDSSHVLFAFESYFQCGKVVHQHRECLNYTVTSRVDLIKNVIPHFVQYPLESAKYHQF